jgi:hypothetical protein
LFLLVAAALVVILAEDERQLLADSRHPSKQFRRKDELTGCTAGKHVRLAKI